MVAGGIVETKARAALQSELAGLGTDGWELVSATAMFNTMMTKVNYTLFLKLYSVDANNGLSTNGADAAPTITPRASFIELGVDPHYRRVGCE